MASLQRMEAMTSAQQLRVRLLVDGGVMYLSAAHETESVSDSLDVAASTDGEFGCRPHFLRQMLATHQADEVVLGTSGPRKPMRITSDAERLRAVVMPVLP